MENFSFLSTFLMFHQFFNGRVKKLVDLYSKLRDINRRKCTIRFPLFLVIILVYMKNEIV